MRLFLAHTDEPDDGHADDRARDRLDGAQQARVARPGDREPVNDEPEQERADDGAEERADDARPEVVRQEDREVPEGDAHHEPGDRKSTRLNSSHEWISR